MKKIHNFHNFIGSLSEPVLAEVERLSIIRHIRDGEPVYRQGEMPNEMYQLLEGNIKVCNYSHHGKEVVLGMFRPGDCFGEISIIDGLPRISHALSVGASSIRVLSKKNFEMLYDKYPEISKQINVMLCRKMRLLFSLGEDACSLNLHQRLARIIHRLSYSHGIKGDNNQLYIDVSQEELGQMLGVSRQSISKELKKLEQEGCIEVRYGKVYLRDSKSLEDQYENLMGLEQLTPIYGDI